MSLHAISCDFHTINILEFNKSLKIGPNVIKMKVLHSSPRAFQQYQKILPVGSKVCKISMWHTNKEKQNRTEQNRTNFLTWNIDMFWTVWEIQIQKQFSLKKTTTSPADMRARKNLRSIPCNCNCVTFHPRNSIHSYIFHRSTHCLKHQTKNHTKFVIHYMHDMLFWYCMILKDFKGF